MPLNDSCTAAAFEDNIRKLVGEGMPLDQAVAAARDTLQRACEAAGQPMPKAEGQDSDA